MNNQDPRAWRVAIALGLESGLDWPRWASGEYACVHMVPFYPDDGFPLLEGWCIGPNDGKSTLYRSEVEARARAVPAPWDADAYLADCARRGVEPGPLPGLSWTGPDGFGWEVYAGCEGVDVLFRRHDLNIACWTDDDSVRLYNKCVAALPREIVARIVTLATATAKAMVGP